MSFRRTLSARVPGKDFLGDGPILVDWWPDDAESEETIHVEGCLCEDFFASGYHDERYCEHIEHWVTKEPHREYHYNPDRGEFLND